MPDLPTTPSVVADRDASVWSRLAEITVAARWLIVAGWVAAAVVATLLLPGFGAAEGSTSLLSTGSRPIAVEKKAITTFGFPLLSQDVLVQHRDGGLSKKVRAEAVARALLIDAHLLPGAGTVVAAIPIANAGGVFPSSGAPGSTALTYLFFEPSVSTSTQDKVVDTIADRYLSSPQQGYVGATGAYVAEGLQAQAVSGSLDLIELAAIAVVFLVVAVAFRSLVAPLVALATVGIAYLVSVRVLASVALLAGFTLPGQLEPLIVILVVGIVADYAIFFLSARRRRLRAGDRERQAVRGAARTVMPLVAVAGTTVAAGTATLSIARLSIYDELGPGMAISAVVAFMTALTFIPAAMALVGRWLDWPGRAGRRPPGRLLRLRRRLVNFGTHRGAAVAMLLVAAAVLTLAALQAGQLRIGLNLVSDLPADSSAPRASAAAAAGFAPGIVAPTTVAVNAAGIGTDRAALISLQHELAAQPGVAGVLGPADSAADLHVGLFVAPDESAARFVVILDQTPLGARAISTLRNLQRRLPALVHGAGLHASWGVTGDTAVASTLAAETTAGIFRVGAATLIVDLLMLALLLRCLLAPMLLVAGSLLSVVASLGLTVLAFPHASANGLTFYVPMAVGVLLLSFGSDYNIFLVGRVWEEAHARSLRDAIMTAVPDASSTITRAGTALALTFALLAIVPLESFRTFAFAMVAGVLLDTFVVRSLLVPAVLVVLGPLAGWPNRPLMARLRRTIHPLPSPSDRATHSIRS